MPTKIDLADVPIIDHHCHALNKTNPPQTVAQYQVYFSESGDPLVKQRDVPHSIMWMWGIRELADYFGCDPTPKAVLEARTTRAP